jgi:hypothetical protein
MAKKVKMPKGYEKTEKAYDKKEEKIEKTHEKFHDKAMVKAIKGKKKKHTSVKGCK